MIRLLLFLLPVVLWFGKNFSNPIQINDLEHPELAVGINIKKSTSQKDGKILQMGTVVDQNDGTTSFVLLRYNANGTPDASFVNGGKMVIADSQFNVYKEFFSCYFAPTCLALDAAERIVVAGFIEGPNRLKDFVLVRFNKDGILDQSFGKEGNVLTDVSLEHQLSNTPEQLHRSRNQGSGFNLPDYPLSLLIQPDGKIVVSGGASLREHDDGFAIVRYNDDGSLDNTFSKDGIDAGTDIEALSMALLNDGKILLAGQKGLVRYKSDGTRDEDFGEAGLVPVEGDARVIPSSLLLQQDGSFFAGGYAAKELHTNFTINRFNANGSADAKFGTGGRILWNRKNERQYDIASALKQQPDGKMLIAGSVLTNEQLRLTTVLRFNKDGTPDATFGDKGMQTYPDSETPNFNNSEPMSLTIPYSVELQSDGKILLYSANDRSLWGLENEFSILRLNKNGSVDKSFGKNGKVAFAGIRYHINKN